MNAPLELTGLTRIFETPAGPLVAVKDVNARIEVGEFLAIIGHSGCGKSTVLSMIAGLDLATLGGVIVDGREVTGPGLERAMVFQRPCLLPWLTAAQNVELAVSQRPDVPARRRRQVARQYLERVGLGDVASERPAELSLGTRQCVALARALALEPRFLLLDEPFSMLDSLTRFSLQETLLGAWEHTGRTVVLVTHDVDEALFLADRVLMMTDGPEATVGEVVELPFPRPRVRSSVLAHERYHPLRRKILDFLEHHARQLRTSALDSVLRSRVPRS